MRKIQVKQAVKKRFSRFERKAHVVEATLGDYSGNVSVITGNNQCYARVAGQVVITYNDRLDANVGASALIGYTDRFPRLVHVVDGYHRSGIAVGQTLQNHRDTHQWGVGNDVVYLDIRQIMNLRVTPGTGLTVIVYPGILRGASAWYQVSQITELDLSGDQPVAGACWVLISVDETGAITTKAGSTVDDRNDLAFSDIPLEDDGEFPIAAVRLYDSQTQISEIYGDPDILDLRFGTFLSPPTMRIGTGGDYTQFDTTGHQTMLGDAQPWDDLRIEPIARTSGTNAPSFEKWYDDSGGSSRGVYLYSFDDAVVASEKEIHFTMQLPHAWNQDDIYIHVHWVGNLADTTAAPRWGLEYIWNEIGTVYGDTTIIYTVSKYPNDTDITAHKHYISAFTAISPTTSQDEISSILIGRLFRNSSDAADTYDVANNKCGLLYIDAHYQLNSLGSTDEYIK